MVSDRGINETRRRMKCVVVEYLLMMWPVVGAIAVGAIVVRRRGWRGGGCSCMMYCSPCI